MNWPRHALRFLWGGLCFGFGFLWAMHQERPPWTLTVLLVIAYITIEALTSRKEE